MTFRNLLFFAKVTFRVVCIFVAHSITTWLKSSIVICPSCSIRVVLLNADSTECSFVFFVTIIRFWTDAVTGWTLRTLCLFAFRALLYHSLLPVIVSFYLTLIFYHWACWFFFHNCLRFFFYPLLAWGSPILAWNIPYWGIWFYLWQVGGLFRVGSLFFIVCWFVCRRTQWRWTTAWRREGTFRRWWTAGATPCCTGRWPWGWCSRRGGRLVAGVVLFSIVSSIWWC